MKKLIFFVALMVVLTLCSCMGNFEHSAGEAENSKQEESFSAEEAAETTLSKAKTEKLPQGEYMISDGAEKYESVPGTEMEIYVFSKEGGEFITGNGYKAGAHSVIAKNSKGRYYVIGNFENFHDFNAGVTHLFGDYYCFAAGKEICFFNAKKGEKLEFSLDFQKPENGYYAFCSVAYDEEAETYVLIYAPDYGTGEAKIAFQRFDAAGNYIDTAETDIPLNFWSGVPSCTPNSFVNGKLQFFRRGNESWYCYDFESREYLSEKADAAFILGETAVLKCSDEEDTINGFVYSLFENGEKVSSLSLYEPDDFYTSGDGKTRLDKQLFDAEAKTIELHYGRAIHKIDFANGKAELSYDFSGLSGEDILIKSPEGKYEIYIIGTAGRADELSTLAVKNTETEEIYFLGEYTVWKIFTFTDEHTMMYDTGFNSIESLDLLSGESKAVQYFGVAEYIGHFEKDNVCLEYAVDAENSLIVAAFTEVISAGDDGNLLAEPSGEMIDYYNGETLFFAAGHIFFEIYDFSGNLLYTVETDFYPDSYRGPTMYELSLDEKGNAVFDCYGGEMASVNYLER